MKKVWKAFHNDDIQKNSSLLMSGLKEGDLVFLDYNNMCKQLAQNTNSVPIWYIKKFYVKDFDLRYQDNYNARIINPYNNPMKFEPIWTENHI